MNSLGLALWTRVFYRYTLSSTFRTNHLYSHRSLSIIHKAFPSARCTFTWSSAWFTFTTLAHRAQTLFFNVNFFLYSIYSFQKIYINLYKNIWSFCISCLLFSKISKKFIKISEKFIFHRFITAFTATFKKIIHSTKRVKPSLSKSLIHLVIACKSSLIIKFTFFFIS